MGLERDHHQGTKTPRMQILLRNPGRKTGNREKPHHQDTKAPSKRSLSGIQEMRRY
jgi:hypothetical protein